jgi:hypothetical protein
VSAALELVAAGEAVPAVAEARALVLEHHTIAAFEGRWRDLLAEIGLLPARERYVAGDRRGRRWYGR